jgi:para-aminobenzoate synthetase component 1
MGIVSLALGREPVDVLGALAGGPGACLVDVPDPERPVTLIGCAPAAELTVDVDGRARRTDGGATAADPVDAIAAFVAETPAPGLVVGYLGYELGRFTTAARLATRPLVAPGVPLAVLRRYDPLLVYDRGRRQYDLIGSDPARAPWLERLTATAPAWHGPLATAPLGAAMPARAHRAAVARILEHLAAGDCYQVNLTQPFTAPLAAPPWVLHERLARLHEVPYGAYLDLGQAQLVANSPELFLRRRGRRVETHPIKGTRPRTGGAARDAALAAELVRDPKERAEHVMIVDLERNDLGRVCVPGSVTVEALARVEGHGTVHHMVSTIAGRLADGVGLADLLRATFPGGSITGAPKERTMEIIAALEPEPRGPYCGALGVFRPDGDVELGLSIRTAVVTGGVVRWGAGGGIVADSDPERELAEAWLKTAALRLALGEPGVAGAQACSSG